MGMTVGTATARPGELAHGHIALGSMADGSAVALPVSIAAGAKDGPVMWLQGAIHGEEYGGAATLVQLMHELDLATLRGTVIALPVVNPTAFNERKRVASLDGVNMNRVFPPVPTGTFSFQVGAAIAEAMLAYADFVLDLHSGGLGSEVPEHMIYLEDGSPTAAKSCRFAKNLGAEVIWRGRQPDGYVAALIGEASRAGIPAVLVENGGGQFPIAEQIGRYRRTIDNAFKAAGMLAGTPEQHARYTMVGKARFLHARHGGLFQRACAVGGLVAPGQAIGHILDLHGQVVDRFASDLEVDGFIGGLRGAWFPTHMGEMVCELLEIEGYEAPEPMG